MKFQEVILLSLVAGSTSALQGIWQQCGGQNWTGGTTCTAGNTCVFKNTWYSQCRPGGTTISTTTSSSTSASPSSNPSGLGIGVTYKATFTVYGSGDANNSPNCQTAGNACGFYSSPGFAAAASQNLFGVAGGQGAGPACGTCWKLVGETDSSGNALSNAGTSIVVMINNLCPGGGNSVCSPATLTDTNQYGANVDFDICSDSGASAAFFPKGFGLAVGSATQVDCSQWSGTIVH